jgi:hypothetical protein
MQHDQFLVRMTPVKVVWLRRPSLRAISRARSSISCGVTVPLLPFHKRFFRAVVIHP